MNKSLAGDKTSRHIIIIKFEFLDVVRMPTGVIPFDIYDRCSAA
jgi:hypothetical protein